MAGEGDVERLVVLLEAKINDFEKSMQRASDTAAKNYARMRAGSKSATAAMERDAVLSSQRIREALAEGGARLGEVGKQAFEGLGAALVPATIGIIGASAAIEGAKSALEDFDKIAKEAKASGFSAEDFQALAFAANLGGVETDQFASAMETFARNTGQAQAGIGRLVTQLKVLDPALLAQIQHAATQKERLDIVADALAREGDAAKRAAIATALFGDGGAKMVEVLKDGARGLDETAQKARALGIVVSNEVIANAEEMSDQFDTASKVLDTQFKEVLIELAPILVSTAGAIADVTRAINALLEGFRDLEDRSTASLEVRAAQLKTLLAANANQPDVSQVPIGGKIPLGNRMTVHTAVPPEQAQAYQAELDQIEAILEARKKLEAGFSPPTGGGGGGGGLDDKAQKRIAAVTASLNRQLAALHETDKEQAEANALLQAGITETDKAAPSIKALADQLYDQKKALDEANEATAFFAQTIESAFEGILDGSKSATDALGDMVKALEQAVLQAALLGTGPLGNIFGGAPTTSGQTGGFLGSILNGILPGHADGTANTGGRPGQPAGIVHGQEAVIPLPSGGKVPVVVQGGGNNVQVIVENNSGAAATTKREKGPGGQDILRVIVGAVARDMTSPGGQTNRAQRLGFGAQPVLTRR
jgi:hypothetical protein